MCGLGLTSVELLSKAGCRQLKIRHEILAKHFARMCRFYLSGFNIFYTHEFILSMIICYFNLVGVTISETEANPPLIVYRYRMLAFPITF